MAKPASPSSPRAAGRGRTVEESSAGGLVIDLLRQPPAVALIGRLDKRGQLSWSLPKGHVEPGETDAQAAVREIREETGIEGEVLADLGSIDFWFMSERNRIHKTVRHFLLRATGGELTDTDPEVVESRWFDLAHAEEHLAYPDERKLVEAARSWLAEHPQGTA